MWRPTPKKSNKQHPHKMVFCYKTEIIQEEAVHNFHFIKIYAEWLPSISGGGRCVDH